MKTAVSGFRIKPSSAGHHSSARTARHIQSADFSANRTPISSSFDINLPKEFPNSRLQSQKTFYQQELIRITKNLDLWEIEEKNSPNPSKNREKYRKFMENLAICVKQHDPILSNCLLRGISGITKPQKSATFLSAFQIPEPAKSKPDLKKTTRDNISQTYEPIEIEEIYPDITSEIQYIKGLIDKIDKLKAPKIIQRLYDLYENLNKLQTDVPSPTASPDPQEFTIGTMGHKLDLTVNIIRNEIRKNLSRHNIVRLKVDKSIQASNITSNYFGDPILEKEQEILNLQRTIQSIENELENTKNIANKFRAFSNDAERKNNELKIELIQIKNKIQLSDDTVKHLKQKVTTLTEKIVNKKKKLQVVRREAGDMKLTIGSMTGSLKKNSMESQNALILCKIAEEKLEQIQNAWAKVTGEDFSFDKVSSIDVSRKFSIYKTEDNRLIESAEVYSPISSAYRRSSSISFSPQSPRRESFQRIKTEMPNESQIKPEENFNIIKPLVHKGFSFTEETEKSPLKVSDDSLSVISENSSVFDPDLSNLTYNETDNKWGNDKLVSGEHKKDLEKPLFLQVNQNKKPNQRLSINIVRENKELNSPLPISPSPRSKSIISALIFEQENIFSKQKPVIEVFQKVSKEIQCVLIGEPLKRKGICRAGTMKVHSKVADPDAFDEETMESLRKMYELTGIKAEWELENLPGHLKIELLKALEGHDLKRCEGECIHLRRTMQIRNKFKGVPYPIKKSSISINLIQ